MANPWTEQEIEFLKTHFGKLTNSDLAERLGRVPIAVYSKARALGLIPTKAKKIKRRVKAEPTANPMTAVETCYNALHDLPSNEQVKALTAVRVLLGHVKTQERAE